MKQFIIEWCINMVMALAIVVYIGIFFLVALLLDDGTTKRGNIHSFMGSILCCNYSNILCKIL